MRVHLLSMRRVGFRCRRGRHSTVNNLERDSCERQRFPVFFFLAGHFLTIDELRQRPSFTNSVINRNFQVATWWHSALRAAAIIRMVMMMRLFHDPDCCQLLLFTRFLPKVKHSLVIRSVIVAFVGCFALEWCILDAFFGLCLLSANNCRRSKCGASYD